jgi:hypothetical protein
MKMIQQNRSIATQKLADLREVHETYHKVYFMYGNYLTALTLQHHYHLLCRIKPLPLIPIIPGFTLQQFIPNTLSVFHIFPYLILIYYVGFS